MSGATTADAMRGLTPLEHAALHAILDGTDAPAAIAKRLRDAVVRSRQNTGGGFFTEFEIPDERPLDRNDGQDGRDVWIAIDGMRHGLGMILHAGDGSVMHLEGYAVGAENTAPIDFTLVRFAVAARPGPLTGNDN